MTLSDESARAKLGRSRTFRLAEDSPIAQRRTVAARRRKPDLRPRDREYLTPAEVERLIPRPARGAAASATPPCFWLCSRTALSEALRVHWNHFDLDRSIFHVNRVRSGASGDHRLRGVEIRGLRRLRREGPRAGDFIFVSERGGPLMSRAVQLMLDRVARRVGLEKLNVHPHSLRHACGYYLAQRGADLRLIQAYLGHRQVRHTTRYVQLSPRRFEGLWDD